MSHFEKANSEKYNKNSVILIDKGLVTGPVVFYRIYLLSDKLLYIFGL